LKPLIELARQKGLFFMEAMWSKFLPAWQYMKEDGLKELGEVKRIRADFSFGGHRDPQDRLLNIDLAGGSILDMGIYVLSMALWMGGGKPDEVKSFGRIGETGVDVQDSYLLRWKSGVEAVLCSSLEVNGPCSAEIAGTDCTIVAERPFWGAQKLRLVNEDGERTVDFPHRANGFEYEIEEAGRCIAAGLVESPRHTHKEMLEMMELMDGMRAEWGFRYPFE
ncbi:MAG: Gfo/Idh/MocA family oxidoreductase, partial [Spirochaetales bacterium]|nr:Gfo/Idh/MocA family oxidoreductase [Spirochaetales bacterium]